MSTEEQYAIITKNILIEERVHNWVVETLQARLQAEEKIYNNRLDKLKQKQERLQAELMGMGDLPIFKEPINKPKQKEQTTTTKTTQPTKKTESLTAKLNDEIEHFLKIGI